MAVAIKVGPLPTTTTTTAAAAAAAATAATATAAAAAGAAGAAGAHATTTAWLGGPVFFVYLPDRVFFVRYAYISRITIS